MSLRSRMILLVIAAGLLPVSLVAVWLARDISASAERMVRASLDHALDDAVADIGPRWTTLRARLLDAAEAAHSDTAFVVAARALMDVVESVAIRGPDGDTLVVVDSLPAARRAPTLTVMLPVQHRDDASAARTLTARVRLDAVVPAELTWAMPHGGTVVVLDHAQNAVSASVFPAHLLERPDFELSGQRWAVSRRRLYEPPLELAVAAPLGSITGPFMQATRRGVVALILVVAGAIVLTLLVANRIARPLVRLAAAADAVADGQLEHRVPLQGPSEIRRVAAGFNGMSVRLAQTLARLARVQALAAVGEFAGDVAHEVRTPLTALRLQLERLQRRTNHDDELAAIVGRTLNEADRLEHVVAATLRLARAGTLPLSEIAVLEPLRRAVDSVRDDLMARQIHLEVRDHSGGAHVQGDVGTLEQLFHNLLRNAAEASPDGGRVSVDVRKHTPPEGALPEVCVEVSDEGDGITHEHAHTLFEPLVSTKPDGTGLGLSISRRIAAAHGGRVELHARESGGTSARVVLPALHPVEFAGATAPAGAGRA